MAGCGADGKSVACEACRTCAGCDTLFGRVAANAGAPCTGGAESGARALGCGWYGFAAGWPTVLTKKAASEDTALGVDAGVDVCTEGELVVGEANAAGSIALGLSALIGSGI